MASLRLCQRETRIVAPAAQILVCAGLSFMFGACLPQPKISCQTDDDCRGDRVCVAQSCRPLRGDAGITDPLLMLDGDAGGVPPASDAFASDAFAFDTINTAPDVSNLQGIAPRPQDAWISELPEAPDVEREGPSSSEVPDTGRDSANTEFIADADASVSNDAAPDLLSAFDLSATKDESTRPDLVPSDDLPADGEKDALPPGVALMPAVLPSPRHEAAVFSDGAVVYIAGGLDMDQKALDQIIRYEPSNNAVTLLFETLPMPCYAAGVAWTGSAAYLFGGLSNSGVLRRIVRYVPGQGATVMKAQLPQEAYNISAVFANSRIYVFGGQNGGSLKQSLIYEPESDTLRTAAVAMPIGAEAPALFWDGAQVRILGGNIGPPGTYYNASDAITSYDPNSGQYSSTGRLPYPIWDAPSFFNGKHFYLVGGSITASTGTTSILRVAPTTLSTMVLPYQLAFPLNGRVATWVSGAGAAFLCGGSASDTGAALATIIRFVP